MKAVMISNFMNHHQYPFSTALLNQKDVEYTFVSLEPIPDERSSMGYADMNHSCPFVLCAYDSEEKMQQALKLMAEADTAIFGSCPDWMVMRRANEGKLCFKFSERYFKNGIGLRTLPRNFASAWKHLKPFEKKPLYFCCSSAYTAADLNRYTNFRGRTFKWGYFPEVRRYDLDALMQKKHAAAGGDVSILWAGRLLDWKHPDAAVRLASALKQKGYAFQLDLIGNGAIEQRLQKMIAAERLEGCVRMLGAMPPEQVRAHMERADIYLFTSDFQEGWGAVLNESMNSGCAVVASHAIGSVPYLIDDGINGLIYENGKQTQLERRVEWLLEHPAERERLGRAAYRTMQDTWNADVAAGRFVSLCEHLLAGEESPDLYADGPCSRAEILDNGWYHAQ